MSKILLISGREVDPFEITADEIDIMDIAHSLSMQCRYAGHIPFFYSVAEHCCRAVQLYADELRLSTEELRGDKTARSILLHDADECYIQDMVNPTKMRDFMAPYRAAGDRIHGLVSEKFDCLPMVDGQHDKVVKQFDAEAYQWERTNIRAGQRAGLAPADAERAFIGAWYLLRPSTFG